MQDYQMKKLTRKRAFINLSRKLEDGEVPTAYIAKKYRTRYPNSNLCTDFLVWTRKDLGSYVLYDTRECAPRFIVSPDCKAVFVPPTTDQKIKRFHYERKIWTPKKTPALTPDALKCVFKHLSGWDLLQCRLVCKQWHRIATNTRDLWKLQINCKPNVRSFIQHMFIGATDRQIIDHLFKHPLFFLYIARLIQGRYTRLDKEGDQKLKAGRFMIVRKSGILVVDGIRQMSIQLFLDAYRQTIYKKPCMP